MIKVCELKTERLILKKLNMTNIGDYIEWKQQEEYHTHLPSTSKTNEYYKESFAELINDYDNQEEPTLLWGIFLKGKLIGSVSIEDWNTTHKWCEIGWGLNPKYQNQGFAYEASHKLIEYIFITLGMNRISANIWDGNNASKKLALKLGFIQEGIERKARYKNDKYIDLYCYGLLKEDWQTK